MLELLDADKCVCVQETLNGVEGYRFTSKMPGYTDKSIFLPMQPYSHDLEEDWGLESGHLLGLYWSFTSDGSTSYALVFDASTPPTEDYLNRFNRFSIRPVFD